MCLGFPPVLLKSSLVPVDKENLCYYEETEEVECSLGLQKQYVEDHTGHMEIDSEKRLQV